MENYEIIIQDDTKKPPKQEAICVNGIDRVLEEVKKILSNYGMHIKKIKSIGK